MQVSCVMHRYRTQGRSRSSAAQAKCIRPPYVEVCAARPGRHLVVARYRSSAGVVLSVYGCSCIMQLQRAARLACETGTPCRHHRCLMHSGPGVQPG